jgi:mannose-1-phosphate guanylyltransferase/mannose-6-phosphate isomerase
VLGAPGERPITNPTVLPVILCGGVGSRLWPLSRPGRTKPFVDLTGDGVPLERAIQRARRLADHILIVGSMSDAAAIGRVLISDDLGSTVLLEPEPRGTAAAIASSVVWAEAERPGAVIVVMPADHAIPDLESFAQAAALAVAAADNDDILVTLGVRPDRPSTAMGYIRPARGGEAVRRIDAFVEKPSRDEAERLMAEGALWNAGLFVGRVGVLASELERWSPASLAAARAGLASATGAGGQLSLGPDFASAPDIAFDRAVMEKCSRGAVLKVDFAWSDLGSWDAVHAVSARDDAGSSFAGDVVAMDARDMLVRGAPGMRLAVVGVERLAVVAEPGAVLVCGLDAAQTVRDLAGLPPARRYADLKAAAADLGVWLSTAALPVWATLGVDEVEGAFREGLSCDGRPHDPYRRSRVQARQAFVFAEAAADGRPGPWALVAERGLNAFRSTARRPDGLYLSRTTIAGAPDDREARIYEHAFVLLALATACDTQEALSIRTRLDGLRHSGGGWREAGAAPFQANAHMHLLEAALALELKAADAGWREMADEIVDLALDRFVSPETGAILEYFDASWTPLTGAAAVVEPGHQFEWAWLLAEWDRRRSDGRGLAAARRLYGVGRRGVDMRRNVVVNSLNADLSVRDAAARLWPQTERLKAALVLGELPDALSAADTISLFIDAPVRGLWRERMRADGDFLEEHAPATSLYHLYLAIRELERFVAKAC